MKIRSYAIVIVPAIIIGVGACFSFYWNHGNNFFIRQSKKEPLGVKHNPERHKRGITLLPADWYTRDTAVIPIRGAKLFRLSTVSNYRAIQIWSAFDSSKQSGAFHKEKEIQRVRTNIDFEIDRFVKMENDSVELLLEVKYSYLYSPDSAWTVSLIKTIDTKDDYLVESRDLSKKQADSVLRAWKLM